MTLNGIEILSVVGFDGALKATLAGLTIMALMGVVQVVQYVLATEERIREEERG